MSESRQEFEITTAAQQQVEVTQIQTACSMAISYPCQETEGQDSEQDRNGRGKDGAATVDGQE